MNLRRLDLDIAIYRDRVQVTDRATEQFVDQRADYPFSDDERLIAHSRYLEDTLVRAIRKVLTGGFSLRHPMARVIATGAALSADERVALETALLEAGMKEVIFDIE